MQQRGLRAPAHKKQDQQNGNRNSQQPKQNPADLAFLVPCNGSNLHINNLSSSTSNGNTAIQMGLIPQSITFDCCLAASFQPAHQIVIGAILIPCINWGE